MSLIFEGPTTEVFPPGIFTILDPRVGPGVFNSRRASPAGPGGINTSRDEPGRVRGCSKSHESGVEGSIRMFSKSEMG